MPGSHEPRRCPGPDGAAAFIAGCMDDDERASFQGHLDDCPDCLAELMATRALLGELKRPCGSTAPSIADSVLARLPAVETHPASPSPRLGLKALAAGLTCAALLVVGALHLGGSVAPEEAAQSAQSETDAAVERALAWLTSAQGADGSWDPLVWGGQRRYQPGISGLALLAFTGSGNEIATRDHRKTVDAGVRYLLSIQTTDGRIGPGFSAAPYNHGIATVALLEVFALLQADSLRPRIGRAIEAIVGSQNADGGWGYANDTRSNMSVTVWQIHALLLAERLGWPEVSEATTSGLSWVLDRVNPSGLAGYSARDAFPNGPEGTTAMAAVSILAGSRHVQYERVRDMVENVLAFADTPGRHGDLYGSFFISNVLAFEHDDISASRLSGRLVSMQVGEGDNAGSWTPTDRWALAGGRVYATAIAAMSLQSRHRTDMLAGLVSGRGL